MQTLEQLPLDVPSPTASSARDRLQQRLRAGAIHLLLSATVAGLVLVLVYQGWYPSPLDRVSGVGEILMLLLAVDVVLGPLMTTIVFDRRKKSLRFDMACIAVMQLGALVYGLYTVEAGRPHYLVFASDRFEVVSRADLRPEDRAEARDNPEAAISWTGPRWVSVEPFEDLERRRQALMESVQGGRDTQHYPVQYRSIDSARPGLRMKGMPLDALRKLNPGQESLLDAAVARTGQPADALRFVPLRGPAGDAAMLIDSHSGHPLMMVDLKPWS